MSTPTEGTGNYTVPLDEPYETVGPEASSDEDAAETADQGLEFPVPVHDVPAEVETVAVEEWTPIESMTDREIAVETLSHLRQLQDVLKELTELNPQELMAKFLGGGLLG